jgi:outer membrane protein assembly factor BamD
MAARDFLAQHEFYVANFYLRTDEYGQAQGRLEYLLATYPDSSVTPKAGELLAELKSGKPLEKSWTRFLPTVSLPSWKSFKSAVGVSAGSVPAQ